MQSKITIPIIAGIAGLVAMITLAFALTTQPRQGSDLALLVPQQPINRTIVGTAPDTEGLISQADAIIIALNKTGLIDERERIEQTHANWFYVDENGQAYRVNPETMEMISTEGDMSRTSEKLSELEPAHYWVIGFQTGIDSGYLLIIDASSGDVKDESALYEV